MSFEDYEPVAARLDRWFQAELNAGHTPRVVTTMLSAPGADICVFRAELWRIIHAAEGIAERSTLLASGHAEEIRNSNHITKTSHVEVCETSALGRALANWNLSGSDWTKRPTREEMQKTERYAGNNRNANDDKPVVITNKIPGKCSRCFTKVEAGAGLATKIDGKWVTSHVQGECPPEAEEPF